MVEGEGGAGNGANLYDFRVKRFVLGAAALVCVLVAMPTAAQEAITRITPVLALGRSVVDIARTSDQLAEGMVSGGGRWLRMTYQSNVPLAGFVVPMQDGEQYNPIDMLAFDLPLHVTAATVDIDLSVSSSWSPSSTVYLVTLASPPTDTPPSVLEVSILPADGSDILIATLRHMTVPEAWVVSTYHQLRGYRVLGVGAVFILAVLIVLACGGMLVVHRKRAALPLLLLALSVHLLYGARVGIDLLRLSVAHLAEWHRQGTYGEAGDTFALAEAVRLLDTPDVRLATCFDATDYFAKLLRYHVLPTPVQIGTDGPLQPTHVAVLRMIHWSYEDGRLRCGSIDAPARLVAEFPAGSRLFVLTP